MARAAAAATPAAPVGPRGELAVELEGAVYPLRPSFAAIGAIEAATGKTLYDLVVAAANNRLGLADVGIVVAECVRAHAKAEGDTALATTTPARMAELVYASPAGIHGVVTGTLTPLLTAALTGGYDASGNRKA